MGFKSLAEGEQAPRPRSELHKINTGLTYCLYGDLTTIISPTMISTRIIKFQTTLRQICPSGNTFLYAIKGFLNSYLVEL